jgi:hypothetical protein
MTTVFGNPGSTEVASLTDLELAHQIESGICHVNDTTVHDEPQTELRSITGRGQPREYPI